MQREIPHDRPPPKGRCGHVPRHYLDSRGAGTHILECSLCGVSTGKQPTFAMALERWTGEAVRAIRHIGVV